MIAKALLLIGNDYENSARAASEAALARFRAGDRNAAREVVHERLALRQYRDRIVHRLLAGDEALAENIVAAWEDRS